MRLNITLYRYNIGWLVVIRKRNTLVLSSVLDTEPLWKLIYWCYYSHYLNQYLDYSAAKFVYLRT